MGRSYWNTGESYKQPNASELQKNARQTMKKEKAKGKQLEPVVIQGRTIVKSWWGQAWCDNLERYADFESRLERGKRYVRTGAVVDLKIQKGKVLARVQGRRKTPYKVEVRISPLSEERCQHAINQCGRKIENLERLLNGDFPKELKELFLGDKGLFPEPREISFSCSCPDWALMCKHVAAVLYGIGARFDENPLLFFELRGIDVERFIDVTLANRVESMLVNADTPSKRIITGRDWENLFGI
ncbi:MAG: SWIM zinc finger family protein [Lachnospiraceae bacterium]